MRNIQSDIYNAYRVYVRIFIKKNMLVNHNISGTRDGTECFVKGQRNTKKTP